MDLTQIINKTRFLNELTRKILHITTCVIAYTMSHILNIGQICLIFCLVAVITHLCERYGLLDFFQNVKRKSYGHYFMVVGIFLVLAFHEYLHYKPALYFSLSAIALADPLAVLGKPLHQFILLKSENMKLKNIFAKMIYRNKTIMGSLIFYSVLIVSFISLRLLFNLNPSITNTILFLLGTLVLTGMEFFAKIGLDNIFIPLYSYLVFYTLIY
jgi:hypothetical protein